jgi:hypothetical protein
MGATAAMYREHHREVACGRLLPYRRLGARTRTEREELCAVSEHAFRHASGSGQIREGECERKVVRIVVAPLPCCEHNVGLERVCWLDEPRHVQVATICAHTERATRQWRG